jgi:DNA-binding CsgD family transcriptional regulator
VAAGLPDKQVAGQLSVSVSTVGAHLRGVYAKVGVRSRARLARRLGGPP